jgi:hypothetical protein
MDGSREKKGSLYVVASMLLVLVFMGAEVSLAFVPPVAACVANLGSMTPSGPSQPHHCCCGEANACCCDTQRGAPVSALDMGLGTVQHWTYHLDPFPSVVAENGSVIPLHANLPPLAGIWTGTGPPLSLSYLVNLTFRC